MRDWKKKLDTIRMEIRGLRGEIKEEKYFQNLQTMHTSVINISYSVFL